jgi:hypothetical protein
MSELGSSGGCVKRRQKTERQKKLEKRKRRWRLGLFHRNAETLSTRRKARSFVGMDEPR